MTPEKLDEYRELVKFGRHLGVGGEALRLLLDHIDALAAEIVDIKSDRNPFSSAPHPRLDRAEARIRALEAIIAKDDTTESFKCSECGAWHVRKPTAPETPVQHVCACEFGSCYKHKLESNQYCHDDRKAAGLAQSDQGEKR